MNENILLDRKDWNEALPMEREDVALHLMETKLKNAFEYRGVKTFSCGGITNHIAVFLHKATKMTFHLLPGGTFNFGAGENVETISALYITDLSEDGGDIQIRVDPILISTYMITEFAWARFEGKKLYEYHGGNHAVDAIERDAVGVWASKIGARLPSEVEWEYACKAGTTSIFYWGSEPDLDNAWTEENTRFDDDHKPRTADNQKPPNGFGILGMIGNLGEWVLDDAYELGCEDWYDWMASSPEGPYQDADSASPDGILRGGWDNYDWKFNRSTSRIACGAADTGCSARIVFGNLLQGEMIPSPTEGKKKRVDRGATIPIEKEQVPLRHKSQDFIDAARENSPKSKIYTPGKTPRLTSYRMKASQFSEFLDFSAGAEKEEFVKNHYIDYFKRHYNSDIDKDLKMKSGTAQVLWEDYVRGKTHDGLSLVYWSFFRMLGRSFFGIELETKLKASDILALIDLGGSYRNRSIPGSSPPSYCEGVEGLTVIIIYHADFETARLSAKDIFSAKGFETFSAWLDQALEEKEDLVLFRVAK